jgi:hypothetical protein
MALKKGKHLYAEECGTLFTPIAPNLHPVDGTTRCG